VPNSLTDFRWDHDPLVYHGCGLTGYMGLDPHTVMQMSILPARSLPGSRSPYPMTMPQATWYYLKAPTKDVPGVESAISSTTVEVQGQLALLQDRE